MFFIIKTIKKQILLHNVIERLECTSMVIVRHSVPFGSLV